MSEWKDQFEICQRHCVAYGRSSLYRAFPGASQRAARRHRRYAPHPRGTSARMGVRLSRMTSSLVRSRAGCVRMRESWEGRAPVLGRYRTPSGAGLGSWSATHEIGVTTGLVDASSRRHGRAETQTPPLHTVQHASSQQLPRER